MRNLMFLLILIGFSSCNAYKFAPRGFLVDGDEFFINSHYELSVYLGEDFTNKSKGNTSGLSAQHLLRKDRKLVKKLGYIDSLYDVLFVGTARDHGNFRLISLINNRGGTLKRSYNFINLLGFQLISTSEGRFYLQTSQVGQQHIYHAVIPFVEDFGKEQYVSLIFTIPATNFTGFDEVADIALRNAIHFQQNYDFIPSRTEILCSQEKLRGHLGYSIPQDKVLKNEYALVKGYTEQNGVKKMIVYTLLDPGQYLGTFKVCKGKYTLSYTNLQHQVLWTEEQLVE